LSNTRSKETKFQTIAFDADDTLWHNEKYYQAGRARFKQILSRYGVDHLAEQRIYDIEIGNLPYYGYGVMSFVLSMIETAIDLTNGEISGTDIGELITLSKDMIGHEVELFEGVVPVVADLAKTHSLMLITKGEALHQQSKVSRSHLEGYFDQVEIVSKKTPETYAALLARHHIQPSRFLMVGNSMRSDVLPVVELGGWAVHVPSELSWSFEDLDPPEEFQGHFYEIEKLLQLPELVAQLENSHHKDSS
jgi:putative hydrolase of the HAD superfamily